MREVTEEGSGEVVMVVGGKGGEWSELARRMVKTKERR